MKLVRNETIENIAGIAMRFEPLETGKTYFHPRATHRMRFAFEVNEREYWGEICRVRGGRVELDLYTRNERTRMGVRVADNAKADWRAALAAEMTRRVAEARAGSAMLERVAERVDLHPSELVSDSAPAATAARSQADSDIATGADVAHLADETTRRENVEYHKGRDAHAAGEPLTANPYPGNPAPDSRFARWTLGWTDAFNAAIQAFEKPADPATRMALLEAIAVEANESAHCVPGMAGEALRAALRAAGWDCPEPTQIATPANTAATISVASHIDWQRICDLLTTGIEGGYSPWLNMLSCNPGGPDLGERGPRYYVPEFWQGGGTYAAEYDAADDYEGQNRGRATIDAAALVRGLEIMARTEPASFADFMAENDDAGTGDVFLQCVLLGEVIYG